MRAECIVSSECKCHQFLSNNGLDSNLQIFLFLAIFTFLDVVERNLLNLDASSRLLERGWKDGWMNK